PTTSAWMYARPGRKSNRFYEIGSSFQEFVTALTKSQVAYDLGSEDIIYRAGTIQNNQFIVGERAYTTVVIPPGMDNLNRATWELLKEYLAAGGNVLAFERVKTIDGKEVADLGIQHASGYQE